MTDVFWNHSTPVVAPSGAAYVPVRVQGAAADGSADTFAQIALDAALLKGADGASAYQLWLAAGHTGTMADYLASLIGGNGLSAYQIWLAAGNSGTIAAFLASLAGPSGASAYQVWLAAGNTGSQAAFLASLIGPMAPVLDAGGSSSTQPISQRSATAMAMTVAAAAAQAEADAAPANRSIRTTFAAAPSLVMPATTQYTTLTGIVTDGDCPEAAYRAVATQPTHAGCYYSTALASWMELKANFIYPDQFFRNGDANDLSSLYRAHDYIAGKGAVLQMLPRNTYNFGPANGNTGIAFQVPITWLGARFSMTGALPGTGSGEVRGTYCKVNNDGANSNFVIGNGNAQGTFIDGMAWWQDHPAPVSGWRPNNYAPVFYLNNLDGGVEFGRNHLFGINKWFKALNSAQFRHGLTTGQVFTTGYDLDGCYDISDLGIIRFWPWRVPSAYIYAWQRDNMQTLRMGRVDGLKASSIFAFCGAQLIVLFPSTATYPGAATFVNIGQAYADFHHALVYGTQSAFYANIGEIVYHGEDILAMGTALSDGAGVRLASGANGTALRINSMHAGYTAFGAINNQSTTPISVAHPAHFTNMSGYSIISPNQRVVLMGGNTVGDGSGNGPTSGSFSVATYSNP